MHSRRQFAAILIGFIPYVVSGQTYTIKTLAGSPPPDAVAATSTGLGILARVAVDGKGNLFFADAAQSAVLRMDAATRILSNIAGNGARGFSGDGGAATSAQLNTPWGVAVDSSGTVYVADAGNHRVRKVSNGVITTVAGTGTPGFSGDGGPAASAQLSSPRGVAVDPAGNLYIADSDNNRIRKVAASNGGISTVAGGGSLGDGVPALKVSFVSPQDVAVDASGNLYVADSGNSVVHKISNGFVTAVAGNDTAGFSGDSGPGSLSQLNLGMGGVAVDSLGNVYIADSNNNRIRIVSNGIIKTFAGSGSPEYGGDGNDATTAWLNHPVGLAADSQGNVYIADQSNGRIRKVSNGVMGTVAGGGAVGDGGTATAAKLFQPYGLALDGAGNLYVTERAGNRARRVSNGVITTVAGNGIAGLGGNFGLAVNAELNGPGDVATDSSGALYVVDTGNQTVRKVANGGVTNVAGTGTPGYNGDGGVAIGAELLNPQGVAVDPAGNVYIADGGNHRLREVSHSVISTIAGTGDPGSLGDNGPAVSAQVAANGGVAVDTLGNVFFGDSGNYRVREISGGVIATVAGNGTGGATGDGGSAFAAQVGGSLEVAVDSAGNLYISDGANHRIRKVSNGRITTIAGTGVPGFTGDNGPALNAQLDQPGGIAVDASGNIYFADSFSGHIRVLVPQSPVTITQVVDSVTGSTKLTAGMPVAISGTGLGNAAGDTAVFSVGGKAAPVVKFVSATSVLVQIPADAPLGAATVTAVYAGVVSSGFPITLVQFAPEIVPLSGGGSFTDSVGNPVTSTNQTAAGALISCTAIGLGPTNPPLVTGVVASGSASTTTAVTVFVGGIPVTPDYAGLLTGSSTGYYQVRFRVPSGVSAGSLTVYLTVGSATSNSAALQVGAAVPVISAIVNGATFKARGAAPNSFISIFGYNFGTLDTPSNIFPAAAYNGVSVLFNGNAAPLYYVFGKEGQMNLVLPSELPTSGTVTVQVQSPLGSSLPFALAMGPTDVGVFRIADPSNGSRINGAVLFANTAWRVMPASMAQALGFPDCSNATAITVCGQPARVGDTITIFLTGLGKATPNGNPASGSLPTGALAPADGSTLYQTVQTPIVTVGGAAAKVGFSGIAPGNAGLYQINATIPAGVAAGDDVVLAVTMPGGTSDTVTIAIRN